MADPTKRADHSVNRLDGMLAIRAEKELVERFESAVHALGITKKAAIEEAICRWLAIHERDIER